MLPTNSTNRSTYLQFDVNSSRLDINLIVSCRMSIIPVLMMSYCFDYFSLSFDLTLMYELVIARRLPFETYTLLVRFSPAYEGGIFQTWSGVSQKTFLGAELS